MKLALYARCSAADQTVDPQLDVLRRYAAARGADVVEYVDRGASGPQAP